MVITHATIVGNNAPAASGGNLAVDGAASAGNVDIRASIVANGSAAQAGTGNCYEQNAGAISSLNFNVASGSTTQCNFTASGDLSTTGPLGLGALSNNGGPTQTIPIDASSPALNRVTVSCPPPASDQRGVTRPQGPACDSGAFELEYRTLTVALAGTGTGSVTGTGIACPGDCTESYPDDTMVTLTATQGANSTFAGWSGGGCTGTGSCTVTMSAAQTVTATFTAITHDLTVAKAGTGAGGVTSAPAGSTAEQTAARPTCRGPWSTSTATPAAGSAFAGWSGGGCSGTGNCTVTISAAQTVTATFNLSPVNTPPVSNPPVTNPPTTTPTAAKCPKGKKPKVVKGKRKCVKKKQKKKK